MLLASGTKTTAWRRSIVDSCNNKHSIVASTSVGNVIFRTAWDGFIPGFGGIVGIVVIIIIIMVDTHIDGHELIVGQVVEDVVDRVELGALGGHVLAPEVDTVTVQPQIVVEREAARQQRLHIGHVVCGQIEAVRAIAEQGHVVGDGPGAAALVGHDLAHAIFLVVVGGDDALLQVAHRQQAVDLEQGLGQVVVDALHYEMRVAVVCKRTHVKN